MGEGVPELAARLETLFSQVPRPGGGLHSSESVAEALRSHGITVTANHISHLRAGRRDNPSARLLAGLAEIFHVPYDYFFDETVAAEVADNIRVLAAIRDTGIQSLMLRAQGLSSENLLAVMTVIEEIRRVSGLDATSPGQTDQPPS